jgi:hypothetical protein
MLEVGSSIFWHLAALSGKLLNKKARLPKKQ